VRLSVGKGHRGRLSLLTAGAELAQRLPKDIALHIVAWRAGYTIPVVGNFCDLDCSGDNDRTAAGSYRVGAGFCGLSSAGRSRPAHGSPAALPQA